MESNGYNGLEENIENLESKKLEDICGLIKGNEEPVVLEPEFKPDLIPLRGNEIDEVEIELDDNVIEQKFIRLMRKNNIAG